MEARKAALTEFGICNRTTFLAHARLAERAVCFKLAIVLSALDDISARRRRLRRIALAGLRRVGLLATVARRGTVSA